MANWAAWQTAKALGIAERLNAVRLHSVQAYYSLVGRDLERETVPMVEDQGLGLLVYSPLAGGYLSGKYRNSAQKGRRTTIPFPPVDETRGASVLAAMDGIAKDHGASMVSIALAWLLHQRAVTSVILGVKRLEQLEENLKATEITLSEHDLERLSKASALPSEYPGWMFASADAARKALFETGRLEEQQG